MACSKTWQPLTILLLAAASTVVTAADPKQQASCKINIQGSGTTQIGISRADLACATSDGKPLVIGVSSTYMRGWSAQFSRQWTGVTVEQDIQCDLKPDAKPAAEHQVAGDPMQALLYFCGDSELHLDQPVVQGLVLKATELSSGSSNPHAGGILSSWTSNIGSSADSSNSQGLNGSEPAGDTGGTASNTGVSSGDGLTSNPNSLSTSDMDALTALLSKYANYSSTTSPGSGGSSGASTAAETGSPLGTSGLSSSGLGTGGRGLLSRGLLQSLDQLLSAAALGQGGIQHIDSGIVNQTHAVGAQQAGLAAGNWSSANIAGDAAGSGTSTSGSGGANLDSTLDTVMNSSGVGPLVSSVVDSTTDVTLSAATAVLLIGGGVNASITGGVFKNNQHAGSMLWVDGRGLFSNTSVTVHNSTFIGLSTTSGSALKASHRAQVELHGCMFTNNTVMTKGGAIEANGPYTQVVVYDSTFTHNNAGLNGAAVHAGFYAVVNVSRSKLSDNSAYQIGGAVYVEYMGAIALGNGTEITKNTAALGGGAGCDKGNITLSTSSIISNNFAWSGGGVFVADCQLNVADSSVISNACNMSGGAGIEFRGSCGLHIINSNITDNYASLSVDTAGGIYGSLSPPEVSNLGSITINMHPVIVTLEDSNSGSVNITNSVVSGNHGDVGGCSIPYNYTVAIEGSNFTGNVGNTTGGVSSSGNVTIAGGTWAANVGHYGAALASNMGIMVLKGGCKVIDNAALMDGGGLHASNTANVTITEGTSIFNNSANRNGGGILARDSAQIVANRTSLSHNTALGNNALRVALGGAVMLSDSVIFHVSDTYIDNNTADSGGGMYAMGSSSMIITGNSSISGNNAMTGGGVRLEAARMTIQQPSFVTKNVAQVQGGGIMLNTNNFNATELSEAVYNNSAPFHVNVGVTPTNLSVSPASPNQDGKVSMLTDDGYVPVVINITGVNGVPCDGEALSALVSSISSGPNITLVNISGSDGGAWLNLPVAPGSYNIIVSHKFNRSVPTAQLSVQLEACNPGQFLASSTGLCQLCPQGSFSFGRSSPSCEQCPVGAECPGGAVMLVEPGFWRSSSLSDRVHRCANPSACDQHAILNRLACEHSTATNGKTTGQPCTATNHSYTSMEDAIARQCSSGYEGNLCGVCKPGYGTNKPFGCRKCWPHSAVVSLYIVGGIALLVLIKGLCHFTVNGAVQSGAAGQSANAQQLPGAVGPHGSAVASRDQKLQPTDLLKTLILYLQYMLIIASLNIEWPETILYPFQALAWLFSSATPETFSLDCVFSHGTTLPQAIKKTLFYLSMPVLMLALLLLYEVAMYFIAARKRRKQDEAQSLVATPSLLDQLLSCTVVVLFFFLPSLARTTFSLFACVTLDPPAASVSPNGAVPEVYSAVGSFWMLDMNQQCYSGYHKSWSLALGMPLLFLLCIALPAAVFGLTLYGHHRMQKDPNYACHYSFLLAPYKSSFCFWEGVMALQTEGLVAISVFGWTLGPYYQTLVMHTAVASVLLLLVVFRPHAKTEARVVMQRGVFCLLVTSLAALSFITNGYVLPSASYGLAMGAILVVFNLSFVLSVVVRLLVILEWANIWKKVVSEAVTAKRMVLDAGGKVKGLVTACGGVGEKPDGALDTDKSLPAKDLKDRTSFKDTNDNDQLNV